MSNYKYLDKVNFPSDIKKLSIDELKILSEEIRKEMIEAVSNLLKALGVRTKQIYY